MSENSLLSHPNLKAFRQHGFIAQRTSGDSHVIGRCPFCEKEKHFYINYEKKKWDCKGCGEEGGYQTFLRKIIKYSQENLSTKRVNILAERRGLEVDTLYQHKIGYNPLNDTYLIPIWDVNQEEIYDIKIYKKATKGKYKNQYKDLYSTAGCKSALYGWDDLEASKVCTDIWLVEGHWDKMAMWEILKQMDLIKKGHLPVGVPGADTFKIEWLGFFKGKNVHVIYDNDYTKEKEDGTVLIGAGFRGAHKVQVNLQGVASEVDFIHWPHYWEDGFDTSDYLVKKKKGNHVRAFKGLKSMLKPEPDIPDMPEGSKVEVPWEGDVKAAENMKPFTGKGLLPEQVYVGYRKWLEMEDTSILDLTFGGIIANRLPGHPLWLMIVGPSSCGKSEIIMSLDKAPRIHPLSMLTTKTLISGSVGPGGSDPSLAARLGGQILAIKDLTELLSSVDKDREAIFSQLRNLWDGTAQKGWGTSGGLEKVYNVKFGMICGVTEIIDTFMERQTALGERYVRAYMKTDRTLEGEQNILWKSYDNMSRKDKDKMKAELQGIATTCLDHDFGTQPLISKVIVEKIMLLSQWVARMRGSVERNKYTQEITHQAQVEMPTRIFEALVKWAYGIAMFHRKSEVDDEIYSIIKGVAIASAPRRQELFARKMFKITRFKSGFTEIDLSRVSGLPTSTCKIVSDTLISTGIFKKQGVTNGFGYRLQFSDDALELMIKTDIYPERKSYEKKSIRTRKRKN